MRTKTKMIAFFQRRSRAHICAAALFFCVFAGFAHPAEDYLTVRMEGFADGVGFVPRQQAVRNAKQAVLEQVLRNMTGLEDLRVFRPLLRHLNEYIPEHELLRDDTVGAGTSVEIDAHVLEPSLQQDVAAIMLPRLPAPPTVQLIVGEKLGADAALEVKPGSVAEKTIVEGLNEHRLKASGVAAVADLVTPAALLSMAEGSLAQSAEFTRAIQADVVMLGTVVTEETGADTPSAAHRHKATATLRVYRGADGKMIDDIVSVAVVHGVDPVTTAEEAVRDACKKVIHDCLTAAVITVLGNQSDKKVLLTLYRPGQEARVLALELALKADPQLDDLEILFFEEGLARLRFDYSGPMSHLVEQLDGAVVNDRKLTIDRVVGREMHATFQ